VVSALDSGAEGPMNACVLLAFLSKVIMHLSGVRPSVRPSVCPIRPPQAAAAGLLLLAQHAG